jgi:predicted metal-dependent TIM-barrel fold hydrolase
MKIKIKLKYPFQFEGREISELEFRRLKTGEVRRATHKGDEMQTAIAVAAISAELPVEAIEDIDAADFHEISEALGEAGFFSHTT